MPKNTLIQVQPLVQTEIFQPENNDQQKKLVDRFSPASNIQTLIVYLYAIIFSIPSFFPYYCQYSSEVWRAYDNLVLGKWEKDSVERLHRQFYKHYLGLNRGAPNVAFRNEMGRLSLKLNIYLMILKFWIHLKNLPENIISRQCLKLSVQLADAKKKSFMNFVFEILQLFGFVDRIELHDLNSSMGQNVHMN